jgi:hypothetical protein
MNQTNPLAKHFRQPAVFLKLPSQGRFWVEDSLTLPANGELPVYPMTTKDEITLRTPDALINGTGVVSVIQSCIPAITNAWNMPSVDVDACLIAIRIASYGSEMNVTTTCPKCKHVDDHTVNLTDALEQIQMPNFIEFKIADDLIVKLKPQNYFSINRTNSITYEEQRIINVLNSANMSSEDKEKNLKEITDKLIDLNVDNLTNSTEYVLLADGNRVVNPKFIKEFYTNTSGALIKKVQDQLSAIAAMAGLKPYNNSCSECSTDYKTEVTFDYASFFGVGS